MKRNVKKIFEILFLSAFVFSGFAQDSESDFKGELYESKKLIVNKGDSMLFLDGSSGNFGFYAIPEQGDPIPLLSKYDSFSSSAPYISFRNFSSLSLIFSLGFKNVI